LPDIRLIQNTEFPNQPWYSVTIDWSLLSNGTLDDRDALSSAVIVALGTDRLADLSDLLPDPDSTDRRGWWGDFDSEEVWNGWPIGCRLWTLQRDKIDGPGSRRGSTVVRVEHYIREALQPFVDRRIASSFSVKAHRVGKERIDAFIQIFRGPIRPIELRFQVLWSEKEMEGMPLQEFITD
jgi:phage gp46-like protein